jgi:hypothetical protein
MLEPKATASHLDSTNRVDRDALEESGPAPIADISCQRSKHEASSKVDSDRYRSS